MSTDTTDTEPDTTPDAPDTTPDAPDTEAEDAWTPPDKGAWEKLSEKAARRDKALREAQAKIKELSGGKDKTQEPSEADKLREGVKRTAARAVLAGQGIADKAAQAEVLAVLSLSDVEVDESGEVDTEALEERVEKLRRIFGGGATARPRPRLDPKDRGGKDATPADPDAGRYQRFLSGRR